MLGRDRRVVTRTRGRVDDTSGSGTEATPVGVPGTSVQDNVRPRISMASRPSDHSQTVTVLRAGA